MKISFALIRAFLFVSFAAPSIWAFAAGNEPIEGFTEPFHDIDVAAAEMGVLTKIHVVEGDRVRAGQLLAQLDDSVLRAALEIVKTEMATAGRLESAQAELDLQTDLLEKLQGLLDRKHASMQEVARAMSQKKVLAARLKTVNEELTIKSYEMRRIERQIDQRRVLAPIDGVVTRVPKQVGEFVSPGDPVTAKVVQLDPLIVNFPVPLPLTRELKKGGKVKLIVEGSGDQEGTIDFISPTADGQSGTTRVRVKILNPSEKIACGVPTQLILASQGPSQPSKLNKATVAK